MSLLKNIVKQSLTNSIIFLLASPVLAQGTLDNPLKDPKGGKLETIPDLLGSVVGQFPPAIGAAAFLFVIIGGFMMVSAGGNEEKIEKGKRILLWTAVGVCVLLMAYVAIKYVIVNLTNGSA